MIAQATVEEARRRGAELQQAVELWTLIFGGLLLVLAIASVVWVVLERRRRRAVLERARSRDVYASTSNRDLGLVPFDVMADLRAAGREVRS